MMNFNLKLWSRRSHRWISMLIAVPLMVILCTGILLLLKKQVPWVQPPTQMGSGKSPTVSFQQILVSASEVSEAEISDWNDIDRLDVRPGKGIVKVRSKNRWEVQLDSATGEVLQVARRRSDLIESIHDGSWFHENAKLFVFLPTALLLLVLWFTGIYLFWLPHGVRKSRHRRENQKARSVNLNEGTYRNE